MPCSKVPQQPVHSHGTAPGTAQQLRALVLTIEHSGTIATWLWEHLVCKQATWFTQACSCEKPVQCPKNWTISQPFLGFFLSLAALGLGSAFRLGVDFVKSPRLDTASFKDVRLASTEASSAWANASHRVKVEIDMQPIPHPNCLVGLSWHVPWLPTRY